MRETIATLLCLALASEGRAFEVGKRSIDFIEVPFAHGRRSAFAFSSGASIATKELESGEWVGSAEYGDVQVSWRLGPDDSLESLVIRQKGKAGFRQLRLSSGKLSFAFLPHATFYEEPCLEPPGRESAAAQGLMQIKVRADTDASAAALRDPKSALVCQDSKFRDAIILALGRIQANKHLSTCLVETGRAEETNLSQKLAARIAGGKIGCRSGTGKSSWNSGTGMIEIVSPPGSFSSVERSLAHEIVHETLG